MALVTKEFAPKRPLRQKAGIAAVIAAVAVTIGITLAGGDDGDQAAATAAESTTPAASSTTPTTSAAKGSLVPQQPGSVRSPGDPGWLTAAPQGISWQRVDGVPLPFSSSDGPTQIAGAVATGYSHTPQGATLAAIQIAMRMVYSPDFKDVVQAQTAVTPEERDQLIAARTGQPAINPDAVTAATLQPVAFKVGAYTDLDATIYYAYRAGDGLHRIARMAVTWQDGDWKYTGHMSPQAPALPPTSDISGFTAL